MLFINYDSYSNIGIMIYTLGLIKGQSLSRSWLIRCWDIELSCQNEGILAHKEWHYFKDLGLKGRSQKIPLFTRLSYGCLLTSNRKIVWYHGLSQNTSKKFQLPLKLFWLRLGYQNVKFIWTSLRIPYFLLY